MLMSYDTKSIFPEGDIAFSLSLVSRSSCHGEHALVSMTYQEQDTNNLHYHIDHHTGYQCASGWRVWGNTCMPLGTFPVAQVIHCSGDGI